jgi:cytoskeletal protein RodZ
MSRVDGDSEALQAVRPAGRLGAQLAAARTAAGLTIEEVARETRVPMRHLKAIEDDNHAALPALTYAIGFVKAFARAVGMDPETAAARFRAETDKTPPTPSVVALEPLDERRLPSRGLVLASVAALVLVIGGLSAWGAGLFDPAPPPPVADAAPPHMAASAPVAAEASATAPAAAPLAAAPPATAPTAPGAAIPAAVAPAVAGASGVVLTAKEDVWLKVYAKGVPGSVKIGVMKAGESFAVPASPPGLVLWTGKAGALTATVNGKALPPLGGPVETVKALSLAPADLLARAAPAAATPAPVPPATTAAAPAPAPGAVR